MKVVTVIRNIVGVALLACAWLDSLYLIGAYGGPAWLMEATAGGIVHCYLLMVPLGLLYGLLALPGGAPWEKRLLRAMVMKLLLIPFFLFNLMAGLAGAVTFFLGGLLLTFIAIFIAWMTLLATAIDEIRALAMMRREGLISTGKMVKHIIFQLIYCADVIDAVVLWMNRRKYVFSPTGANDC